MIAIICETVGVSYDNNNNISFICMTIIMYLQYCKQFVTMKMQCNDYYSQSSVISMI